MVKLKPIFFLVALLPVFSFVVAQSPVISTSVDKTKILIGEQIHLKLQATFSPENYRLKWFEIPEKIDHFEIVTVNKIDTSAANSMVTLSQTLVLTSFDSGRRVIPAFKVDMQQKGKAGVNQMFSDSVGIDVLYSPTDSIEPFHDIKNIIEVKKENQPWKWIIFGLIAVLIAIIVFLIFKKYKKKKAPVAGEAFSLNPYGEAMAAFDQLKKEQLLEKGEVKEYFGRISAIFKRFLSGKTSRNQMNLTTDEILVLLAKKGVDRHKSGGLAAALKAGDAVKFAKYQPSVELANESLEQVQNMVEELKNMDQKTGVNDI